MSTRSASAHAVKSNVLHSINDSPVFYTRFAGICYLAIILAGILGQIFIRGSLVVPGDAAMTVANIAASPALWRSGFLVDLLMHIFDIPLMIILYFLFKPVNKLLASVGLAFNMVQTCVLAANKLTLILPALILSNQDYQAVWSAEQISAQIALLIDLHNHGFALGLIFFGLACCCYGYLLFYSGYFPRWIGAFIAVAGVSYMLYSFTLFMAPQYSVYASILFVLCLVGELSFCLWLLFKGVDTDRWKSEMQAAQ